MAKKKKDDLDVVAIVESEGLGYAVQHYLNANDIENPVLAEAWRNAHTALDNLQKVLYQIEGSDDQ